MRTIDALRLVPTLVLLAGCQHQQDLEVTLEAGHIHVFREVSISFRVRDMARCTDPRDEKTCPGVPGLAVVASHEARGVREEQVLQAGILEDAGEGKYTWTRMFPFYGPNSVSLRFIKDNRPYFAAFALETSRAGGESYFCDRNSDGTPDHAFQIRWDTSTGAVKADGQPVTFSLELLRSYNAPPLNTTQPWRNSFDHLRPLELEGGVPTVRLMADTGASATEIARLTPAYRGRGIYAVSRAFTAEDLGGKPERKFWLGVRFTDDKGCVVDNAVDTEEYIFPVVP